MTTHCPKCKAENPDTQSFCGDCGTQLSQDIPDVTKTFVTPIQELTRGTVFASRYEIQGILGKGGMGEVYRVKDVTLDEEMALKVLRPEITAYKGTIKRFKNELKLARKITHKNVCRMYDLNEEGEIPFITMEYVQGEDLKQLIKRDEKLSEKEAISIAKQVCEGLSEAHKLGVVHRDLKPSNIMIDEEGNAKVMDFGIARSVEAAGVTQTGVMIGTPDYISPEQAEGEKIDQRSDIYSLGVILYEMMTGSVPFKGDTALSVALKHKTQFPKAPRKVNPKVSEDMSHLILVCLEKEREKRYQSVEEFLSDLTKIEKGLPTAKREVSAKTLEERAWKNSIAVLPFTNMSADPEQEYFCDGISEELINALTKIKKMRVVARTSTFAFKGKNVGIDEIGKKLKVDKVLEGSVQKVSNRLRITAQLINVEDGYHLWSERFDLEMDDIFAIQDEISLAIVDKLEVDILGEEKAKLVKRYTKNTEAYKDYLKGLSHWYKLTPPDLEASLQYFESALEKDPNYALAHTGIALVWIGRKQMGLVTPNEATPKVKKDVFKALELDNTLAEVHYTMALFRTWSEWDWEGGETAFQRAIEINPNYPDARVYYSNLLCYMGRPDEALAQGERALELDPLNSLFMGIFGNVLLHIRRYDDVIVLARNALRTSPNDPVGHYILWVALHMKGMYAEALVEAKAFFSGIGLDVIAEIMAGGYETDGYSGAMNIAAKTLAEFSRKDFILPFFISTVYALAGEKEQALEWLERGYEIKDPNMPYMARANFDILRDEPRYQDLLRRMNLPEQE
jgi:serine/threonine-protein kinase